MTPNAHDPTEGNVSSATSLYDLLQGVNGETTTAELLAIANERGAGPAELRALQRLPEQDWASLQAAVLTATTGWE